MCAVSGQTFDWHGRGAEVLRRCVSPSYVLRAVRVHFSTRNSTDLVAVLTCAARASAMIVTTAR